VILKNVKGELENDKMSPTIGDGQVTVMVVYDYNCNYCKKADQVLDKILASNEDVKVIYKPYPILSESSEYMTKVILAVNKLYPDQFKPIHSAFMGQKISSRDDVIKILENYKVSVENVEAEFENADIKESLTKLGRIAATLKIQGVPVFIIGDELYPGMLEEKALNEIIANNLPKKKEEAKNDKVEAKEEVPAPVVPPVPAAETQPVEQKPAEAKEELKIPSLEKVEAKKEELKLPPLAELEVKKEQAPAPAPSPAPVPAPKAKEPEAPKSEPAKPAMAPKAPPAAPVPANVAPAPKAPVAKEKVKSEAASDMQKEQKEVKDQLSEEFSKFMNENALEEEGEKKEASKVKGAK
jgi:hypothetical protein